MPFGVVCSVLSGSTLSGVHMPQSLWYTTSAGGVIMLVVQRYPRENGRLFDMGVATIEFEEVGL